MARYSLLGCEDGVYKIFVGGQCVTLLCKRIDGEWHFYESFDDSWRKIVKPETISFLNKIDRTIKLKKLLDK